MRLERETYLSDLQIAHNI